MNTSGLLQSLDEALWTSLTLQENRSIHDSMNFPKIKFNNFCILIQFYIIETKVYKPVIRLCQDFLWQSLVTVLHALCLDNVKMY